jgi:hypothetical protein
VGAGFQAGANVAVYNGWLTSGQGHPYKTIKHGSGAIEEDKSTFMGEVPPSFDGSWVRSGSVTVNKQSGTNRNGWTSTPTTSTVWKKQAVPPPPPRPRPPARAAAPAPAAAPKPAAPAFNLSDYTSKEGSGQTGGFMRTFIESVNKREDQSGSVTNTTPSLYEKFAADYERKRQERSDSFTRAAPAPAGNYAQDTTSRQDYHTADRMARAATGSEPESTRFAGGSAFNSEMGRGYEQLDRTYEELTERRKRSTSGSGFGSFY